MYKLTDNSMVNNDKTILIIIKIYIYIFFFFRFVAGHFYDLYDGSVLCFAFNCYYYYHYFVCTRFFKLIIFLYFVLLKAVLGKLRHDFFLFYSTFLSMK